MVASVHPFHAGGEWLHFRHGPEGMLSAYTSGRRTERKSQCPTSCQIAEPGLFLGTASHRQKRQDPTLIARPLFPLASAGSPARSRPSGVAGGLAGTRLGGIEYRGRASINSPSSVGARAWSRDMISRFSPRLICPGGGEWKGEEENRAGGSRGST